MILHLITVALPRASPVPMQMLVEPWFKSFIWYWNAEMGPIWLALKSLATTLTNFGILAQLM